jgi:short-subunit dehydrogenase
MQITNSTIALITGASSGLGAGLAVTLGKRGAKVALVARRKGRLEAVAAQVRAAGGTPFVIVADVSDQSQAERAVRDTIKQFGALDLLINNAGRELRASVEETTQAQLQNLFALNVFALWYTTTAALPAMKSQGRGHIVNISSIAGKIGSPYHSAYIASKHAVVGFTAALRTELLDTGIETTVALPLNIVTELDAASEGGGMYPLYAKGQERAAAAAPEPPNYPWTAMSLLLQPEEAAEKILAAVENPEKVDVYTHPGSEEIVLYVTQDRAAVDRGLTPFYLGMREAYEASGKGGKQ